MDYRIGSLNVKKLNFAARDSELGNDQICRRDYDTIGRIIRENFHIVALQEVINGEVLSRLFPPFCGWKYSWEQSKNKFSSSDEGYAFAWDTRYLSAVKEPQIWNQ